MQKIYSSRSRLERVAWDIIQDFDLKPRLMDGNGNAILVADSIYTACKYYEIFQQRGFKKCAIISSYTPQAGDLRTDTVSADDETETFEKYEIYLRMLGFDPDNLHNRSMHISGKFKETDFESAKVDIENAEEDIESQKADIRNKLLAFSDMISEKTINHTFELFSKYGKEEYFGRTIVEDITGLKSTRASELIKLLVDSKVIVSVTGHGKGKYRFQLQ